MIVDLDTISRNVNKVRDRLNVPKQTVPPVPLSTKTVDDEGEDELDEPHYKHQAEDTKYIVKCYKYLCKLGLVESQYQFSEQFLNKNKYYFGMILCEYRHPSIDSVHNLIRNISDLNDGFTKKVYFDRLYEEGQSMITKRLLRYF